MKNGLNSRGASAVVLMLVVQGNDVVETRLLGVIGQWLQPAFSVFHAEVAALDSDSRCKSIRGRQDTEA